jgi:hypothetical protein
MCIFPMALRSLDKTICTFSMTLCSLDKTIYLFSLALCSSKKLLDRTKKSLWSISRRLWIIMGTRWSGLVAASGLQMEDAPCALISHIGARGVNRNAVGRRSKNHAPSPLRPAVPPLPIPGFRWKPVWAAGRVDTGWESVRERVESIGSICLKPAALVCLGERTMALQSMS